VSRLPAGVDPSAQLVLCSWLEQRPASRIARGGFSRILNESSLIDDSASACRSSEVVEQSVVDWTYKASPPSERHYSYHGVSLGGCDSIFSGRTLHTPHPPKLDRKACDGPRLCPAWVVLLHGEMSL
jgi:hypothetical protein